MQKPEKAMTRLAWKYQLSFTGKRCRHGARYHAFIRKGTGVNREDMVFSIYGARMACIEAVYEFLTRRGSYYLKRA